MADTLKGKILLSLLSSWYNVLLVNLVNQGQSSKVNSLPV